MPTWDLRHRFEAADVAGNKPARERGTRQVLGLDYTPVLIGHSELEDGLCKIDGNGSSIYLELIAFEEADRHANEDQCANVAQKNGGVHPIIQADGFTAV